MGLCGEVICGWKKAIMFKITFTLSRVELENKSAFIPGPKEFSRGGGKSMATILSNLPESESKQHLSQIQTDDPELYAEIKKHYIAFDDLINSF